MLYSTVVNGRLAVWNESGEEVANKSKNSSAFSLGTLEGAFTFPTERTGTMVTFYAPNVHIPAWVYMCVRWL